MGDRKAKLRKLSEFRNGIAPYISANALECVLKGVQEKGVPDLIGRNAMRGKGSYEQNPLQIWSKCPGH